MSLDNIEMTMLFQPQKRILVEKPSEGFFDKIINSVLESATKNYESITTTLNIP